MGVDRTWVPEWLDPVNVENRLNSVVSQVSTFDPTQIAAGSSTSTHRQHRQHQYVAADAKEGPDQQAKRCGTETCAKPSYSAGSGWVN